MSQKMLIDASHNEETRVVVVESQNVEDFDFESLNKSQLSGNIYLAKVTRVEPSLQAAFLDYGGNRHGFLAFSEIHPDYYQIPIEEKKVMDSLAKSKTSVDKEKSSKSRKISRTKTKDKKEKPETIGVAGKKIVSDVVSKEIEENLSDEASVDNEGTGYNFKKTGGDDESLKDELLTEEAISEENIIKRQHRKFRIQEVIKVRQILLIQIVKEERGNKGAALTTYLSLAGRYCVLMPNTPRGGGISRKITNLTDRKRLKDIANSLSVPQGSGLIVRTAGSNRTKLEIKRDYEYLIRQWEQVRDLTLSSIAPTPIYEEGSLIKRAIRDLYSRSINEILVEGDRGYREAKDYMKMLMPSHAKNVKKYEEKVPLFTKHQVEDRLAAMFNPVVQLRSGGYIVIDVTEALVAVDVNSGRATKESSIEDTALKTNLEAAEELARQIKLRDLAGLIVIDFIDMEDRKNNLAVEKRMKERLKNDRARTQIGRISVFGLLEMSRQRLRPGMIETSTQSCPHCHGTGITRSDDSLSLAILRELEEEGITGNYRSLSLRVPINIANYMLNEKREHIATIEGRYSISIKIEADNLLISPDYKIERIKNLSKKVKDTKSISTEASSPKGLETNDKNNSSFSAELSSESENAAEEDLPNKRRRRRRRRPKAKIAPSSNHTDLKTQSASNENTNTRDTNPKSEDEKNEIINNNEVSKTQSEEPKTKIEKQPKKTSKSSKNIVKSVAKTEVKDQNLQKVAKKGSLTLEKSGSDESVTKETQTKKTKTKTPTKIGKKPTKPDEKSGASKRRGWWSIEKK